MLSNVVLPTGAPAFLRALRAILPSTVNLDVNSGTRTARRQASAMLGKLTAGGEAALRTVYRSRGPQVTTLLGLPHTVDAWSTQIQAWAEAGLYMSRHMRGGALDLAVRYPNRTLWPSGIRETLKSRVRDLGGRPLYESAPPHLHVDLPTGPPAPVPPLAPPPTPVPPPAPTSEADALTFAPAVDDIELEDTGTPVGDPGDTGDTGYAAPPWIPSELPDPDEPEDADADLDYGGFRFSPAAAEIEITPTVIAAGGGVLALVALGLLYFWGTTSNR